MALVLLIDSDEQAATSIARLLAVDHFVERVASGEAALVLLSEVAWDVVILDPAIHGLDSDSLMRNIREPLSPPEVVVVTPQERLDTVVQTLRAGAFEFVPKPVDDAKLVKAVANAAQFRSLRDDKRKLEQHQRAEREHLAALIHERTQQIQQMFTTVPGLLYRVVVSDTGQRRFSFVSMNCEELLELGRDVLLSDAGRFDALLHADDAARFQQARALAETERQGFRFEGRFVLRSGKTKWLQCVAQPTAHLATETTWDGAITDVTERNELNAQLLLADRLASVGSLAAAVAHEVNNPLAYIQSHLAQLEQRLVQTAVDERSYALLREVIDGVDRISVTIGDLRTFARSAEDSPRPLVVTQVIDRALRLASNEIRHRALLRRSYESDARVLADESTFGQLFLNLIIAVAQSIPEGDAAGYEIQIRVWQSAASEVSVEISDTGPGLPADVLSGGFQPLPSQPFRAGSGLYVCHRIVNTLGGRISAGRKPLLGNSFLLTLPCTLLREEKRTPVREVIRNERVSRILVVDDEELVVMALCRALEGHEVVSAHSGREAIELLERGDRFDLVLCDVMMPDLTGADVYEAADAQGLADRIVFITGGAFTAASRSFLESVPNRWIQKPFSREGLRSLLAPAVGK